MPIDVSKLEVSVIEGERCRRTLRITVPSAELQAERRAAVRELSTKLKLPGFRSGKVPAALIEQRFGRAVEQEMIDRVIGEAYRGVLQGRELQPISEGEVAEVEYKPESDLRFQISFDVAPRVELARVGGFRVKRPELKVSEEEVEAVLARMREQEGTWTPVDSGLPQDGDRVAVRIERLEDPAAEPRPYEFVLGRGEAIPDVETAIRSLEVGASGEFTVRFPDDVEAEERRGKEDRLRVSLDQRKRLVLPDLDDAFAARVGKFGSLAELRDRIREDMGREAERTVEAEVRGRLIEEILSANPFDIPESMIDRYVRAAIGDPKDVPAEQLTKAKEQLRPRALHTVKRHIVIDRIAERENLAATTEEVDNEIERIAERSGAAPHHIYAQLQKADRLEPLEREITERKVFDYLKAQSEITDAA
jgi:trigger factor